MFRNVTDNFVWIGSDAWASRESVVYGREEVVEGAIAIQPLRYMDFYDKFLSTRDGEGCVIFIGILISLGT